MSQENDKVWELQRELRDAQDKLVQSERMAAIGSLVVTYNHNINNLLELKNSPVKSE